MAHHGDVLDTAFRALADPTRRAVVSRLRRGPATVGELAEPFPMALTSFLKHLRVLEQGGWIRTAKQGRVRTCRLEPAAFAAVEDWLGEQRSEWEQRTDRLERVASGQADPERRRPATPRPSDERTAS
ncbi:ArsR family transcriptional regulator [Rathayibacter sp. Leaf299]|uniref:ArsR/SmtB family transcription factor n=1 Tax=Rathayibacter sp. Leaf299 TaxID=1736328 RepID=UPI0006F24E47|nr:metalloregulator ArsR/SmtB family transcription factor [Rathayibacter sp. Leaf299]KQQ18367.1 ArsR family transcriptional regulator [Rathayibacter sp. Leaf299]